MLAGSSRLRPVLHVAGRLCLLFLLLNCVLASLSALVPGWLPRRFFGVDFIRENRLRALSAQVQYRDGLVDREKHLVVILGLSSASEGIFLQQLSQANGERYRYLGLCGAGRNMQEVALYARPLLQTGLRADLVVLAINPFHLIDGSASDLNAAEMLGFWFWIHRGDVRHTLDLALMEGRTAMSRFFDFHFEEDLTDPWREMIRLGLSQTVTEAGQERKVEQYGRRRYYDPTAYLDSQQQADTLVELIHRFAARQARVLVVLMPEHSALRSRVPPEGIDTLFTVLGGVADGESLRVVDFREGVADTGFADISHMNGKGRSEFNPLLAQVIDESMPRRLPLMQKACVHDQVQAASESPSVELW